MRVKRSTASLEKRRIQGREYSARKRRDDPEGYRRRQREWRIKNPNKTSVYCLNYRNKYPEMTLIRRAVSRAREHGFECSLSEADFRAILEPMVCSVTGIPLSFERGEHFTKRGDPWAPSFDRIDNSKGYVAGNVRLVCLAFNVGRNEWPEGVFAQLAQAYVRGMRG